ncbi:MAG: division/cell wall cluster transcriptional repressor MraZ [Betaproteobacteria bacterium]|nr:division/cell wall cluster transcriptional repressor MraZ [Betaproteobacteria bacterium]
MFRGIAQLNLDSKGRLAVPARHREVLLERCGGHVVITADADRCLLVYPLPDWELIQQKLEGLSNLDPRVRELQRRLIGFAVDVEIDGAGRILIAPALRQYAQLDKSVVLVGQGRKFELWNQENWEQLIDRAGGFGAGGLPPELEGFSL